MFCEKCGTKLEDTDKFCPKCGSPAPIPISSASAEGGQPNSQDASGQSEKSTFNMQDASEAVGKVASAGAESAKKLAEAGVEGAKKLTEKGKELAQSAGEGKNSSVIKVVLIAGAAAAVLLIVVIANFAALNNFLHKTFSSPEKYYQYVEKKNVEELAKNTGSLYDTYVLSYKDFFDTATNASVTVELDDAGQDLLQLAGLAGVNLSWIENASLSGGMAIKDDKLSMNLSTAVNKDKLASLVMMIDVREGEAFIQIPELTSTYIGVDLKEAMGYSYDDFADEWEEMKETYGEAFSSLPSQAKFEKLLGKYMKIALGCVEDVNKKSRSLKVQGVEQKCTVLEVTIDARTVADMLDAILEEANRDQELKNLIVDLAEAYGEDGDEAYDDLMDDLEYLYDELRRDRSGDEIVMTVYVDGKGNVVGRELKIEDMTIARLMPEKGSKFGYELSVEQRGGESVSITGSGKRSGDKIDGDFNVNYNGAAIMNISTDDLNLATLKKGQLNGKLTVSLGSGIARVAGGVSGISMLQDMELSLTAKSSSDSAQYSIGLVYDKERVGSLSVSADRSRSSAIKTPNDKNVIFVERERDFEKWVDEIDWDKVVSNLEKTDLPRSAIRAVEDFGDTIDGGDLEDVLNSLMYELMWGYRGYSNYLW